MYWEKDKTKHRGTLVCVKSRRTTTKRGGGGEREERGERGFLLGWLAVTTQVTDA